VALNAALAAGQPAVALKLLRGLQDKEKSGAAPLLAPELSAALHAALLRRLGWCRGGI
jgi:hypothetical protein